MRYIYLTRKIDETPFEANLYVEVQPGQWIHADKVPDEIIQKATENDNFKAFEVKGKPMSVLNLADVQQRLIAARLALTYAGKKAKSLREIDEAIKQIKEAINQVELDELIMLLKRLYAAEGVEEVKTEGNINVEMLGRIAETSEFITRNYKQLANPRLFAKLKWKIKNALREKKYSCSKESFTPQILNTQHQRKIGFRQPVAP